MKYKNLIRSITRQLLPTILATALLIGTITTGSAKPDQIALKENSEAQQWAFLAVYEKIEALSFAPHPDRTRWNNTQLKIQVSALLFFSPHSQDAQGFF